MKININEKAKIVALWFTNNENPKKDIPENVKQEIEEYRKKKYKICIYESGNENIKTNLLNLIINNAY